MPKSNGNKKSLSLHLFFKTFFDSVKTQQDSLLELQNTLLEFKIAKMTDTEGLVFKSNDGTFNLKCVVSDKRSYSFINSTDDKSSNKRTDSDHIREYLYTFFCADNFSAIDSFAEYFKKFCSLSSDTYAFYEDFCKDSFDNSDKQRELTNFMESLGSDSLRTAWMFAFLCFPKTPSEKNTDYRLFLLNKILQSGHSESEFQPLDITGNDKQIEKINSENIGRSEELEEIKKEVLANNTVLVYGIGGIGKSYICRKLFWNYYDSFSDGIEYLAWIQYNGDLTQSVTSSFYDPETNLDNIRKKYENHPVIGDMFVKLALTDKPDDKMQVIKEYFSKLDSKLLVFIDNADTMTKEEKKWLNSCKCRMIITSRQKIDGFYGVNINSPSPAYCKEMYIRESRGNNWDGYSLDEDRYIEKITELANYHTQTVMLIAKAQYCLGLSSEEMLEELNATGFVLQGYNDIIDTEEYELTMAEHLTKIFNLLNVTDEAQLKTIRLFSLLAPNTPIKKRDIKKWFELKSLTSINELVKYGWLNSSGSEYVSIHPVIADVVKYNYKPDFEFALPLINALQEEMKVADDYIKKNAVIVHATAVAKEFDKTENLVYAKYLSDTANTYLELCSYDLSEEYYKRVLKIQEKTIGVEHQDTASTYSDIGWVYIERGDINNSIAYFSNALDIRKQILGENSIEASNSFNDIGVAYWKSGDYVKAFEYLCKALEIRKNELGEEHSDIAKSYNNIAVIYCENEDYNKALELYKKSFDIIKTTLGSDDPYMAILCNNIGGLYLESNNFDEALNYHNQALNIRIRKLGIDNPSTADSYYSIGQIYSKKEDYTKSLDYYKKALRIQERVLGVEHPETAYTYNDIGLNYYNQGDYTNSLIYYNKAILISEKTIGFNHPETARVYYNISLVYRKLCEYEKALEFLNKSYQIRQVTLGESNSRTIKAKNQIEEIKKLLSEKSK